MKRNRIVLFILILIATSITLCAESKEQFINVGNIKIIKPQLITINREDITININKTTHSSTYATHDRGDKNKNCTPSSGSSKEAFIPQARIFLCVFSTSKQS